MPRRRRPLPIVLAVLLCLSLLPLTVFAKALPADAERVTPPDPRVVQVDAALRPGGPVISCSGFVVGPNVVLTLAYCIYNIESGAHMDNVTVYVGRDGASVSGEAIAASAVRVPTAWIANPANEAISYGLIVLERPIATDNHWFALTALSDTSLFDPSFEAILRGYADGEQWRGEASPVIGFDDRYIEVVGMSTRAAALFNSSNDGLIGLAIDPGSAKSTALRITMDTIAQVFAWCADLNCTVAWSADIEELIFSPDVNAALSRTWNRTDLPIVQGAVSRTWMWGPTTHTGMKIEDYAEGPGGKRMVVYFEKTRMEVTVDRNTPFSSQWFVTNGLLSKELITGQVQIGNAAFESREPAHVNVAGDPDDATGPTYATFTNLLDAPAAADGAAITQRVDRTGNVTNDLALAAHGATAAFHVSVPDLDHQVASPFWTFMNSSGLVLDGDNLVNAPLFANPFYATGYPITEAYWASVKVAGVYRDVLMQCFERRCLTYDPGNAPGWQVEAGNVGLHYLAWRYGAN